MRDASRERDREPLGEGPAARAPSAPAVYGLPRSRGPRGHYTGAVAGTGTAAALDRALEDLGRSRGLWPGDASVTLELLSSLAAEVSSRLPRAVDDARAYGLSWAEVANLLGVTRASAWERFGSQRPEAGTS
ncbi:MAG: hypothetical protein M0005_16365 [Actinomycetota bacterium]|nr:hypothetical protein [Actinomycetota bacterium]